LSLQGRVFVNARTSAANTEIVSFANWLVNALTSFLTSPAASPISLQSAALSRWSNSSRPSPVHPPNEDTPPTLAMAQVSLETLRRLVPIVDRTTDIFLLIWKIAEFPSILADHEPRHNARKSPPVSGGGFSARSSPCFAPKRLASYDSRKSPCGARSPSHRWFCYWRFF
jgi:hypothetical protein